MDIDDLFTDDNVLCELGFLFNDGSFRR